MRRIVQSDHSLYLKLSFAMALMTLASCGNLKSDKNPSTTGYSTTAKLSVERDLTSEERVVATRICYAYQSKSSNFRTKTFQGATFNFDISTADCGNKTEKYSIASVLTLEGSNLIFKDTTSTTVNFQSKVQTNETGYLSQLCTKIQNNLPISNTFTEGNLKVQVKFGKDTMDFYTLQYFSAANTTISSSETFQVRTQFDITNKQILGMDEVYQKFQTCPANAAKASEFTQKLSTFVTK